MAGPSRAPLKRDKPPERAPSDRPPSDRSKPDRPSERPLLPREAETEAVAALAKALGHPARIHIVRMLFEKRACIGCDIVDEVGLAQSTTSEHLRILKAAGIITGEIERPRVCYSLNPEALRPLRAFLAAADGFAPAGESLGAPVGKSLGKPVGKSCGKPLGKTCLPASRS